MVPVQLSECPVRRQRAVEVLQRLRNDNERLRELVARDPKRLASVCCPEDSVLIALAFVGTPLIAKGNSPLCTQLAQDV